MTAEQLINLWLNIYPHDWDHPDLLQMALAGYVHCRDGFYRDWDTYIFFAGSAA